MNPLILTQKIKIQYTWVDYILFYTKNKKKEIKTQYYYTNRYVQIFLTKL